MAGRKSSCCTGRRKSPTPTILLFMNSERRWPAIRLAVVVLEPWGRHVGYRLDHALATPPLVARVSEIRYSDIEREPAFPIIPPWS